jgi:peptidoglycan/xylan/chitin deacetylase (PgdA/CDA1 family)
VPYVVCYHVVSETWHHPIAVQQATLLRQVSTAIRLGLKPVTLSDVVAGRSRALHVTFDDGYRSVLAAVPALERLGVRPSVFVCTDYASDGRPLDLPPLDSVSAAHRDELATLRWDELRELAARGVEVGSHTRTHPDLRGLPESDLRREVAESREAIEDELGRPCRFFAYPYGQADDRIRREVERAGYRAAFGLAGVGKTGGPYAIGRIELTSRDGMLGIALKSSPAWPFVSRRLRRVRGAAARVEWTLARRG